MTDNCTRCVYQKRDNGSDICPDCKQEIAEAGPFSMAAAGLSVGNLERRKARGDQGAANMLANLADSFNRLLKSGGTMPIRNYVATYDGKTNP